MITKKYEEYCKKCNNEVKGICQTCYFFRPTVFYTEDENFYDEELGIFTLWIWNGYCMNEAMPNIFPAFYHKTKSNKTCKWCITKKEFEILSTEYEGKELTFEKFKDALNKLRIKEEREE